MAKRQFHVVLLGQCPSGKNSIQTTRTGHRYPKQRFVQWRDLAVAQAIAAVRHGHGDPFLKPTVVAITVAYYYGDRRRRDVPGMLDAIFHVLERAGIVEDDAQIRHVVWTTVELAKESPRVVVALREV